MLRPIEQSPAFYQTELASYSQLCFGLYPLSEWDVSVIMSCLRAASWHNRWLEDDNTRISVLDYQDNLTSIENLERRLMSNCLDDLVDVLAEIKTIMATGNTIAQSCCAGGGTGFVSDGAGGFYYGTEEPISPPTTFGGTGEFATEADYLDHLCLFANNLVSGLIVTSNNLSIITSIYLFAGTIIVTFFVASPPAALLLAILLAGFANEAFADISVELEANREAIVCAIYNATGLAGILTAIENWIADILTTLGLSAFEQQIQELYRSMLTTDTLNQAYTLVGLPPVGGYTACTGCGTIDDIWGFDDVGACSPSGTAGTLTSGDFSGTEATCASSTYYWSCNPGTPIQMIGIKNILATDLKFPTFTSNESDIQYWSNVYAHFAFIQDMPFQINQGWAAGSWLYVKRPGGGAFTITFTVVPY